MQNKLTGFILFASIVLSAGFTGCKKDNTPAAPTTIDLMVKAPWKLSKVLSGGTDVTNFVTACIKDNLLRFNVATPANTGSVDEGATKCNAADAQISNFTWELDPAFNRVTITGNAVILPGSANTFTLVRVNDTEMVISQNVVFFGVTQTAEATLVH
jgi:hypothetical protein